MRVMMAKLGGYVCTAGLAAVIDLGGFVVLIALGWPVVLAAAVSFGAAMLFNYAATSLIVFRQPLGWGRLLLFAGAALVGLAVNVGVTSAAMLRFGFAAPYAKTAGIGVAFVFNFLMTYFITFRRARDRP